MRKVRARPRLAGAVAEAREKRAPVTLNERAYELLRLEILTFRLRPGEKISERLLAARYSLGMAAVRAALPRLVQEGFVEKSAERGTMVAPLTLRGVRDLYQMRYLLEPEAAALAAQRGVEGVHLERLDRLRRVCETRWADENEALTRVLLANRDFNSSIAESTGNALLARTVAHLQNLSLRVLFLGTPPREAPRFWSTGPAKIRDAIVAGDAALARELYRADLAAGERWATRVIMALPEIENINLAQLTTTRSQEAPGE
jgi:GntR family transcriptional regulator, rspAB operon transcriptional repressor